jgi:hypothetical protein
VAEPLIDFVRADRQRTGFIILGVTAVLLAVCGWLSYSAYKAPGESEDKKKAEEILKTEEDAPKPRKMNRNEYLVGAVLAAMGVVVGVFCGGWMLVTLPPTEVARQRTEARALILAFGGLLGAIFILASGVYFYLWGSALLDVLDKDQQSQAKYVIGPLLAFAVGGVLMFLAIQPARAEERDNLLLRRLIYGANFGLSVLILFVVLIILNVVISPRLPNKLDVTASGFYTLSPSSVEFVQRMPEPVTAYAILQGNSRDAEDIRRLLDNIQSQSNGKFTVKYISTVSNVTEYRALAGKYPVLETGGTGVLLTVGEDGKRHAFIRDEEFIEQVGGGPMSQQAPTVSFVGETRVLKELLFLAEGDKKAVVYFTQSAGELDIGEGRGEVRPSGSALKLKEFLTRYYLDVRPLKFDRTTPKVPDDAAVVIVAQPREPLAEAHVAALTQYMTEPRAGKKGKLIVLAGASFAPPNSDVRPTGLEPLLQRFNVRLDPRVVIGTDTREFGPFEFVATFSLAARRARNPIAASLGDKAQFSGILWHEVDAVQQGPQEFRAIPLLETAHRNRFSWLESQLPKDDRDMNRIINELNNSAAVQAEKRASDDQRSVGVAVSENDTGRLVVVGNGIMVSDQYAQLIRGEPLSFDFVSSSIDWLRDRPPLPFEITKKKYVEFKFPMTADENRVLWVPLLLALVLVTGLGASVWVVRRRM